MHHALIGLFANRVGINIFRSIIHCNAASQVVAVAWVESVAVDAHRIGGFAERQPEIVAAFRFIVMLEGRQSGIKSQALVVV